MTEQQAHQWLMDNELLIKNVTQFTKEQQTKFFEAYNALHPIPKTQTSCGRCIHNMRVYLQDQIKQLHKMKKYEVYRTDKGNLSFKQNGDCIFVIRCSTDSGAKEALLMLKKAEKRGHNINDENIDPIGHGI